MKTTVIDVRDLLSPLSARGVEKQLAKVPGIKQVDVNSVSGSATVLYDETVTGLDTIKAKVRECGHHCGGELVPKHLCEPEHPRGNANVAADSASAILPPIQPAHANHTRHGELGKAVQPTHPTEHADMDSYLPGGLIEGTYDLKTARTAGFTVLVFTSLFTCFNARSDTTSAFTHLFVNPWLWGAITMSALLQVAVVNLDFLNLAFGTVPLALDQWLLCVAMASVVLWYSELRKLASRAWGR